MSPTQPTPRPGGRSERVRSAVHQAVIDMLSDPHVVELTIPVVAQLAGVNHTSIYRRWGSREALLADVAITRLEEGWPLPDTGTLRGDLTEWVAAGVASIFTSEGQLIVRALALSMPGSSQAQTDRVDHFERRAGAIRHIRERATARGENPPPLDQILDQLIAPLYLRAVFGSAPPPPGYPEVLVERLLGGTGDRGCPEATEANEADGTSKRNEAR